MSTLNFTPDINGDQRTDEEATWPIKAQCRWCGGRGEVRCDTAPAQWMTCPHEFCQGRGYFFLPLGD